MTPRTWKAWAVIDPRGFENGCAWPFFDRMHPCRVDAVDEKNAIAGDSCSSARVVRIAVTVTELPRKKRKAKGK